MTKPEDYRTHVDDGSFWADGEIAVVREVPELKAQAKELWFEAKELHLIFSKIWRSRR
jgi:hypothetical protein